MPLASGKNLVVRCEFAVKVENRPRISRIGTKNDKLVKFVAESRSFDKPTTQIPVVSPLSVGDEYGSESHRKDAKDAKKTGSLGFC